MAEFPFDPFSCEAFPGLEFGLSGDRERLQLIAIHPQIAPTGLALLSLHRNGFGYREPVPGGFPLLPGVDQGRIAWENPQARAQQGRAETAVRPRPRAEAEPPRAEIRHPIHDSLIFKIQQGGDTVDLIVKDRHGRFPWSTLARVDHDGRLYRWVQDSGSIQVMREAGLSFSRDRGVVIANPQTRASARDGEAVAEAAVPTVDPEREAAMARRPEPEEDFGPLGEMPESFRIQSDVFGPIESSYQRLEFISRLLRTARRIIADVKDQAEALREGDEESEALAPPSEPLRHFYRTTCTELDRVRALLHQHRPGREAAGEVPFFAPAAPEPSQIEIQWQNGLRIAYTCPTSLAPDPGTVWGSVSRGRWLLRNSRGNRVRHLDICSAGHVGRVAGDGMLVIEAEGALAGAAPEPQAEPYQNDPGVASPQFRSNLGRGVIPELTRQTLGRSFHVPQAEARPPLEVLAPNQTPIRQIAPQAGTWIHENTSNWAFYSDSPGHNTGWWISSHQTAQIWNGVLVVTEHPE